MTNIRVLGVGLLLSLATACTVEQRSLGDEPENGGSGGRGGSKPTNEAGSGTVLPGGGGTAVTSGGATQIEGGATQIVGGATQIEGGATQLPSGGTLAMGGATLVEGGASGDTDCFSPTNSPELAIDHVDAGCACNETDPDQCVRTAHEGRPWDVALVCEGGRWQSVEDGPCGDGRQAACRIKGIDYANGQLHVPDPYSCNECECQDGKLTNCTQRPCKAPEPCPDGTKAGSRCVGCGPTDACTIVETGCIDPNDGKGQFCG